MYSVLYISGSRGRGTKLVLGPQGNTKKLVYKRKYLIEIKGIRYIPLLLFIKMWLL